ncbi:MAG: putative toxin-antitoxin system toxin component, PIN family [Bacteroidales bacterium]|nr:putative toxin-antitoxin system toxin component, PIN family [Bacteroidales bacterium]
MQNFSKRVIFDSNIWVSFAIGKRLNELRMALTHPKIEVFVCRKLLWEVSTVIQQPKLFKYISQERQKLLLELMQACQCVGIVEQISISRDPNDDYLLDLAATTNADFLVTGDNDLLILKTFQNASIVSFASFMAVMDTF